jgi:trehalose 6-phosphate phosphatase
MIFELRPPIEINKGTAFHSLVNAYQLDSAIYMGDDTTDVDALHMARKLRQTGQCYALGIGVQSPDMPDAVGEAADVMVSGVSDVEDFLDWLFSIRSASST